GDHWPAGFQGESGRRSKIRADAHDTDHAWLPADARPDQEAVLSRGILQHLAKLSAKALRGQSRRFLEKLIEPGPLQRADTELGENLLLAHTVMQGVQNRICSLGLGIRFDDGLCRPIGGPHWIGYAARCAS